jgi:hypothetical protein
MYSDLNLVSSTFLSSVVLLSLPFVMKGTSEEHHGVVFVTLDWRSGDPQFKSCHHYLLEFQVYQKILVYNVWICQEKASKWNENATEPKTAFGFGDYKDNGALFFSV